MVRPDPPVPWDLGWHEACEFLDGLVRLGYCCLVFQRRKLRLTEGTCLIQGHRESKQLHQGPQSPPPRHDAKLALRETPRWGQAQLYRGWKYHPSCPLCPSVPDREKPRHLSAGYLNLHTDILGQMILCRGAFPSTAGCLAAALAPIHGLPVVPTFPRS